MKKHFFIICGCLFFAVLYAITSMADPFVTDVTNRLAEPSQQNLLGTDHLGRDIFSRLLLAGGITVGLSTAIVLVTATIGVLLGTMSGFVYRRLEPIVTKVTDATIIFPDTVLAIVLAGVLGPSIQSLVLAISLIKWTSYTRLVHTLVLQESTKGHVLAARVNGLTKPKIALRHVLPAVCPHVLVVMSLDLGKVILLISAFSFIGLGVQLPFPEWGGMISEGRHYLVTNPMLVFWPALCIVLTIIGSTRLSAKLTRHFQI
ncbi:ABC transporter permease subunit [Exiguobacterium sp. SL-10]|uniref:ABC transporter permease n=1 Tax=unclassified Exiguobacterium TaxID=2644629 RepID=UPI001039EDC4|nr:MULTISPECIES: ABC transporter permease [unclassified Exiguobacterium]TCI23014.1 ABC transporter permease subunit [Exiguobacterium sp. SL-9]TCI32046.1 ABC transporter permease subunit [Exiguobacterium sp. SL-10]